MLVAFDAMVDQLLVVVSSSDDEDAADAMSIRISCIMCVSTKDFRARTFRNNDEGRWQRRKQRSQVGRIGSVLVGMEAHLSNTFSLHVSTAKVQEGIDHSSSSSCF